MAAFVLVVILVNIPIAIWWGCIGKGIYDAWRYRDSAMGRRSNHGR